MKRRFELLVMRMHRPKYFFLLLILIFPINTLFSQPQEIGKWKRFEAKFENTVWKGNPNDIVMNVIFTAPSGKTFNQFGFYAGKNTWKVFFMPDETGKWSYRTKSSVPGLNGSKGAFQCIESGLEPPLAASGKQWKIGSEKGNFPVIWSPVVEDGKQWGFRGRDISDSMVQKALVFADEEIGARLLGIGELLVVPVGWAKDWPQSALPYVRGKEGDEFYQPFWDKLNAKLDAARDRNMGAYIMLYGDDEMRPDRYGLTPRSDQELRFFRYVVARLACYPHLLWDTGIDIGEYRKTEWINWFANWFLSHDPWEHPVSSRSGGGSGGSMPENGTYFSTGGASLPLRTQLLEQYSNTKVPLAQTDHWRPFISRGNWNNTKIRIAMWRCGLTGAMALYPDYSQGTLKNEVLEEGGKFIGIATAFFRNKLHSDLLKLQPHDELITEGGNAILTANPGTEYIVYDEDGGNLTIDLITKENLYFYYWYNPRTGETVLSGKVKGGVKQYFFSPATGEDWVLHIYRK